MKMKISIIDHVRARHALSLHILTIMLMFFFTTACDKIPADERQTVSDKLPDWRGQYVLLQDFTGVNCTNCPASTREIKRLQTVFGDKLIVVKLHPQSSFNEPLGPIADTNVDLRNAQAHELFEYYGRPPLPKGVIMQKYRNSDDLLGKDLFYGRILPYYARQTTANIELTANLVGNTISINTDVSFIDNHNGNSNTHLSLMILEDNLLVTQATTASEGHYIRNYRQDHVLRDMATPIWGDQIAGSNVANGTEFNHKKNIELNSVWKRENLSVVAILFDNGTKEVIQCAVAKINY